MTVNFDMSAANCETRLAQFLAELVRQGVKFIVRQDAFAYEVTLTGGF